MRYFLILLSVASHSYAQNVTLDSAIMQPIHLLFTGMNLGDSAMVRKAFAPKSTLATVVKDRNGGTQLRYEELEDFLTAVAKPHPEPWTEPIWDVRTQSDGNLAQVWAKYAFYVGKKFSHCGVDAFQLFRDNDGRWKIFFIADTRQTKQCEVPPSINEKVK